MQKKSPVRKAENPAAAAGAVSPAIILVGKAAAMDLHAKPLSGVCVGITGTEEIAGKQRFLLEQLGAKAMRLAVSRVRDLPMSPVWETTRPHWLVFTSGNGVKRFFRQLAQQGKPLGSCANRRFAVIGAATQQVLEGFGIRANLCPETFTSEALALALAEKARPEEEILLLRSVSGTPVLRELLEQRGFTVRDVAAYALEPEDKAPLPAHLDYLTFSSAGGVELFFHQYGSLPQGVQCVCIGDVTARALEQHTSASYLLAEETSAAGIINTILNQQRKKAQ